MRQHAAEAIASFSSCPDDLFQPLLELLNDEDAKVVQTAMLTLGRVGKDKSEAEASLLRFTNDPNPLLKETAVVALARLGRIDDQSVPVLLKTLESTDDLLSSSAVAAIGQANDSQAVKLLPGLNRNLETGQNRAFKRSLTALLLMKDRTRQSLDRIVTVYEKVPKERRPDVLKLLIELDSTGGHSLPILAAAIQDSDPEMRKISLWGTVRTIQDRDVLKSHLEKGLNDSVPEMQVSALKYLHAYANRMPDMFPQVLALTKHDAPRVRMAAVDALVPFKAKSTECLEALNYISEHDSDPEVRAGTYYAFARMDLEFASKAESLLERISRTEEDTKLRNSAKLALMSLRRRLARDRGAMIPGEELGR